MCSTDRELTEYFVPFMWLNVANEKMRKFQKFLKMKKILFSTSMLKNTCCNTGLNASLIAKEYERVGAK